MIEVALAKSQSELGIIPQLAAARIESTLDIDKLDLDRVAAGIAQTEHSLVPLLQESAVLCGGYASQFLHFGATTQDIQDTGQALEMRAVLDLVDDGICALLATLCQLAADHKRTIMVGRTHARAALPTTFGLKAAGWADEVARDLERLRGMRPRVLVAQLFGGVGTMSAFGERALELLESFAKRLGLGVPDVSWHVSRDRVVEFVAGLAMLTGSLARIADEIRQLGRPEFGELFEVFPETQIGSSTMPHKQNPEACEQVVVLAKLTRAQVAIAFESMQQEHERDYRGTRLEWPAVGDASHYTCAAVELTRLIVDRLRVRPEAMRQNAQHVSDAICSEALMMRLGSAVGKTRSFDILRTLSAESRKTQTPLGSLAVESPLVTSVIGQDELRAAVDPTNHRGQAEALVERVLARVKPLVEQRIGPPPKYAVSQRHPRYGLVLRVRSSDSTFRANYLSNLSAGGLRVDSELEIGAHVHLELSFPGLSKSIKVDGEVRWSRATNGSGAASGIEFVSLSDESRGQIAQLLELASNPIAPGRPIRALVFEADQFLEVIYQEQLKGWGEIMSHDIVVETIRDVARLRWALGGDPFDVAILDLSRHPTSIEDIVQAVPKGLATIILCTDAQARIARAYEDPWLFVLSGAVHYGGLVDTVMAVMALRGVGQQA